MAATSSTPSGTGKALSRATTAFSAYPPPGIMAAGRRPSAARPMTSTPGSSGSATGVLRRRDGRPSGQAPAR
ncbi:hypothetical protein [Nonomuraea jabiensis]|uniref:hypothetical protein n=1 Tax=Nonomuraea jabiensis TaxID=882448 RepID=UPI003D751F29